MLYLNVLLPGVGAKAGGLLVNSSPVYSPKSSFIPSKLTLIHNHVITELGQSETGVVSLRSIRVHRTKALFKRNDVS